MNNSTRAFTIAGGLNGGSLTKSGSNTLTLGGANTFGGGLTLNAGSIVLANEATRLCRGEAAAKAAEATASATFSGDGLGADLPVFEVDERYSTTEALAAGAKDADAASACIILEQHLRSLP